MSSFYGICSSHAEGVIQMFCSDCDQPVCLTCITETHRGHHFDKAAEYIAKKRSKIESVISSFNIALGAIDANHEGYTDDIEKLCDKLNERREEWKSQIDDIADSILAELKEIAEKDLEELNKRKADLKTSQSNLKKFLHSIKDDVMSILDFVNTYKEKGFKPCETPTIIVAPKINDDKINVEELRFAFGKVVTAEMEMESDFDGSFGKGAAAPMGTSTISTKTRINPATDPSTVTTITRGIPYNRIATIGTEEAWVAGNFGERGVNKKEELYLVNKEGQFLQRLNLGFTAGHFAATSRDELLVTDYNGCQIKRYTLPDTVVSIMNTSPYKPIGLCTTSNNEMLVCLSSADTRPGKVQRLTFTGEIKQSIEDKELFRNPKQVKENINSDVCIVDIRKDTYSYLFAYYVVVVNKDGKFRFEYPEDDAMRELCYIECDQLGYILLSDYRNDRIHMIDRNGKFIQYLLINKQGLQSPIGISINCRGELWVSHKRGEEVRVVKYRSL